MMMTDDGYDIFISYARSDRDRVRLLANRLVKHGWSIWWDEKILPGRTFDAAISHALNISKCVLVIWSRASVRSDWVKEEAARGAERQALVPIRIDDVELPLGFSRIQTASLVDWHGTGSDPQFKRLLVALEQILGKPKPVKRRGFHRRFKNCFIKSSGIKKRLRAPVFRRVRDHLIHLIGTMSCPSRHFVRPGFCMRTVVGIGLLIILLFVCTRIFCSNQPPSRVDQQSSIDTLIQDKAAGPALARHEEQKIVKKASIVSMKADSIRAVKFSRQKRILRDKPDSLTESEVKLMLKKHGFFDSEWNVQGKGINDPLHFQVINDDSVVIDSTTGLMWQRSGSRHQMSYQEAQDWLTEANQVGYAGYFDWHIPTLEQAMTLVQSKKNNGILYLDSLFDARQTWIWTSDVKTGFPWHWVVIFIDGRCYDNLFKDDHFVRAVRSIK